MSLLMEFRLCYSRLDQDIVVFNGSLGIPAITPYRLNSAPPLDADNTALGLSTSPTSSVPPAILLVSALDEIICLLEDLAQLHMHATDSLLIIQHQAYIEEAGWHHPSC